MSQSKLEELDHVLGELQALLKNPEAGAELAERGVNISLAVTLADGLRAYVHGQKESAILDLETATAEIAARMARAGGLQS